MNNNLHMVSLRKRKHHFSSIEDFQQENISNWTEQILIILWQSSFDAFQTSVWDTIQYGILFFSFHWTFTLEKERRWKIIERVESEHTHTCHTWKLNSSIQVSLQVFKYEGVGEGEGTVKWSKSWILEYLNSTFKYDTTAQFVVPLDNATAVLVVFKHNE